MKRALLISPYFIPCNLAGVHRARLLAKGLPEFGWEPTVLTVDPRYYGNLAEPGLTELIPQNLRIEYVDALAGGMLAVVGGGDFSLRGFLPIRGGVKEVVATKKNELGFFLG